MSYDIDLVHPDTKEVVMFSGKHQLAGGTYCVGGTNEASLNITYNYSKHYMRVFMNDEGVRSIYGMKAIDSIPVLAKAASQLKDDRSSDYWEPTEGNAKKALLDLIALASITIPEYPDAIWHGD